MLHYALQHLTGYDLPIASREIPPAAQPHTRPSETGLTPGVETTTATPWGRDWPTRWTALAERLLAAESIAPASRSSTITPRVVGAGCLMEGISHEAPRSPGRGEAGKLIAIYDDNGISIDGEVRHWFTDDSGVALRAYQWDVIGPSTVTTGGRRHRRLRRPSTRSAHADHCAHRDRQGVAEPRAARRRTAKRWRAEARPPARRSAGRSAVSRFRANLPAWDARGRRRANDLAHLFEQYAARHHAGGRVRTAHGRHLPPELPGSCTHGGGGAGQARVRGPRRKASQLALEELAEPARADRRIGRSCTAAI